MSISVVIEDQGGALEIAGEFTDYRAAAEVALELADSLGRSTNVSAKAVNICDGEKLVLAIRIFPGGLNPDDGLVF